MIEAYRPRILLIEDNPLYADQILSLLRLAGYQADLAHTGKEALEKGERYNLAIVDLVLPDMFGIELIKAFKEINPTMDFIVITGHATLDSAIDAVNLGVFKYIRKSADPGELIEAVRAVFKKQSETMFDPTTELYNHSYFSQVYRAEFERAKRYSRPLSLLVMDIDNFKQVNDTHGHVAGDAVLARIGRIVRENVRASDVPARWHERGDELIILFPETKSRDALAIGERLRHLIAQGRFPEGITVTVSGGVASYPEHATDPGGLIVKADNALNEAKRSGRNRICIARA